MQQSLEVELDAFLRHLTICLVVPCVPVGTNALFNYLLTKRYTLVRSTDLDNVVVILSMLVSLRGSWKFLGVPEGSLGEAHSTSLAQDTQQVPKVYNDSSARPQTGE